MPNRLEWTWSAFDFSWYAVIMTASNPPSRPLKVLIVEDNNDARTTLRLLLVLGYGHVVYQAPDGLRAL
jgi:hypothetical protein